MKINPKNFYQRELDILPPHFVNTVVKAHDVDIEKMRKWIYEYCTGRYSITKDVVFDKDKSKAKFCASHKEPEMVNVLSKTCEQKGCQKIPS